MPIETTCQTCGKRLRVGDEHAGKVARCPGCQTVYAVPQADGSITPLAAGQAQSGATGVRPFGSDRWHLKTPDGLTFGPVTKSELDQWQREGRIVAQSQLMQEGSGQWLWAGTLYPQLGSLASDSPFSATAAAPLNPYAPPGGAACAWPMPLYCEQHRGPVILTMAIVGLFFCNILSIVTVVMAIIDLRKMANRTMDPSGRGLTIAGLIIGSLPLLAVATWVVVAFVANAF